MVGTSIARLSPSGNRGRRLSLAWKGIPFGKRLSIHDENASYDFMSRQLLIPVGFLLLGLISGLGIGLFMGGGSPAAETADKPTASSSSGFFSSPEAQNQVEANTLLSNRILELEKELAEQKNEQHAALADRMAFFKKYQREIWLNAFDNNLKVTPEMAELLGLSKEEQQEIEQQLAETKSEMDKIEDADTVLAKQTANGVTYDIPADPQGKALKDKLTGLLTTDIGDDRAGLFLSHFDNSGDHPFSFFGEQNNEIEITWTTQNGNKVYTTRETTRGPNSNSSWSMSGDSVQPQYQKYLPTNTGP
jgi:hypothetical protein